MILDRLTGRCLIFCILTSVSLPFFMSTPHGAVFSPFNPSQHPIKHQLYVHACSFMSASL